MKTLDWIVLALFFGILIGIGLWAFRRVKGSKDLYIAGGNLPWWLAGISHHVSGYSGVMFTGYAAIAYTLGFTIYIWWAANVALVMFVGAFLIAPRWTRVRQRLNVESPTEYLKARYNVPTQQFIAWVGVLLKLLDTAAKWTSIGILINGFTGLPMHYGILITGVITMVYVTAGGLWADTANDVAQFIVQVLAGIAMFVIIGRELGGASAVINLWDQLPPENGQLFREPYTVPFALSFMVVLFISYNGGTWNLATRFLASRDEKSARKCALLSGTLYLIWPLVIFMPMWAAPLLIPNLESPEDVYSIMTLKYLPAGLVGLVLASMFAATMSMTASDANTVSSVLGRDILPIAFPRLKREDGSIPLWIARSITFGFILVSIVIALNNEKFGGILGLIIKWFGGLIGPASIPMVLGLVAFWKHCGPVAAFASIIGGVTTFLVVNFAMTDPSLAASVGSPVIVSLVIFTLFECVNRLRKAPISAEVKALMSRESFGQPR